MSAWAGPVISIAAVLCAAIAVTYASGTRVEISIPVAADIGGPTPTGSSAPTPLTLNTSAVMLVHPTHPVEVLEGSDSSIEPDEQPSLPGHPATTTAAPTIGAERDDEAGTPKAVPLTPTVPAVAPTPSSHPTPPTGTWSDDDPTRSPRPTSSVWTPTATPSPSTSHSHHDDSEDDSFGGAPQPSS